MFKNEIFITAPTVQFSNTIMKNDDILHELKKHAESEKEFKKIKRAVNTIFKATETDIRYYEDENKGKCDYVVEAINKLLKSYNIQKDTIDTLYYGGIVRDYFEPATAMEIAHKSGFSNLNALDITSACTGFIEATSIGAAMLDINPLKKNTVICTSEFNQELLSHKIKRFRDLKTKAAGLTVGGGAAAWVLSKNRFDKAYGKVIGFHSKAIPAVYDVCKIPIHGSFKSDNQILFKLAMEHLPNELNNFLSSIKWKKDEVDHYLFHQPSNTLIVKIANQIGLNMSKVPLLHHLFANCATATTPSVFSHEYNQGKIRKKDKIIMIVLGGGFTFGFFALEWLTD